MDLKKYALRLEYATLYRTNGAWKTVHSRWDIELFKLLYGEEDDQITIDSNIEHLKGAVLRIFGVNDEKLTVSILQTLYNTIAVNNIVPLEAVHKIVSGNIPNLSREAQAMVYGVIMSRPFLLLSKDSVAEELTDLAALADPQNPDVCYNLALNFAALGKFDKAAVWCDKTITLDSGNADVLYTRACIHMMRGNVENALADLGKAVKMDRKYSELAKQESFFEAIRQDERFLAIIK